MYIFTSGFFKRQSKSLRIRFPEILFGCFALPNFFCVHRSSWTLTCSRLSPLCCILLPWPLPSCCPFCPLSTTNLSLPEVQARMSTPAFTMAPGYFMMATPEKPWMVLDLPVEGSKQRPIKVQVPALLWSLFFKIYHGNFSGTNSTTSHICMDVLFMQI